MTSRGTLAVLGGTPITVEPPPRWPEIGEEDVLAVTAHLRHGELSAYEVVSGPLYEFEAELRARFDCEHALLVSSGTAALQSALFGLKLVPGDEVIVPSITFPGTASAVLHCGATVRLADVDPETGNPGLDHLRAVISNKTRAVLLAHAWGLPADLPRIVPYLEKIGVPLVEDAARAFGTRCLEREVGSIGIAGCLSFHELKAVPAGEGGVLLTSDRVIYERAVALGHYFRCKDRSHLNLPDLVRYRDSSLGLNLKIHPLAACLARSQLARLPSRMEAMAENLQELAALLEGHPFCRLQRVPVWAERVSHYGFNVHWRIPPGERAPSVAAVVSALRAEGVRASAAGSPPLFRLPLFREKVFSSLLGHVEGSVEDQDFPGAIAHFESLLRLPTLFTRNSLWVQRYAAGLWKVYENAQPLAAAEQARKEVHADRRIAH